MNKYYMILTIAGGLILTSDVGVQAVAFTLEYKGDNIVTFKFHTLDLLTNTYRDYALNSEHRSASPGDVYVEDKDGYVTWIEISKINSKTVEKKFRCKLNAGVHPFNLGGRFTVYNNGEYDYDFGPGNKGHGNAEKVQEIIK